jgi:hypothetical protein
MKAIAKLSALALAAAFLAAGCKDAVNDPPREYETNYYPIDEGDRYVYRVDSLDEAGTPTYAGETISTYAFYEIFDGASYLARVDSFGGEIDTGYFRDSERGSYIYADTSGLTALVPDSLLAFFGDDSLDAIDVDVEFVALSYPLDAGRQWPAFRITALIYSLVGLDASVAPREELTLALDDGERTFEAVPVSYTLTVAAPDTTTGFAREETFEARAWYAEGVGVVKIEGDAVVLYALDGRFAAADFNPFEEEPTLPEGKFRRTLTSYERGE